MTAIILDLLLKITVILGAAAMIAFALNRSSAAWRHFVWSAAMASVLVLIVVQLVMPPLVLRVNSDSPLRAFARHDDVDAFETVTASASQNAPSFSAIKVQSTAADLNAGAPTPSAGASSDVVATSVAATELRSAIETDAQHESATSASRVGQGSGKNAAWLIDHARAILLSLWALGTLLLLARLVRAHQYLRTLVRSAHVLENAELDAEVTQVRAQLSEHRAVTLLSHPHVHAPCTAGWRAPMIMFSDAVMQWSKRRRRAVLTHELAHIVRGDSITQTVASVVCALFWFHPLVWIGARAVRGESERAADDVVLGAGMSPVEYADHLLAIANRSAFTHAVPEAAIGLAKTSQLETRLRAMLSAHQSRRAISRATKRAVGMATLLAVIPLAGAQVRVQPPTVVRSQPGAPRTTPPAPVAPSVNARIPLPREMVAPIAAPPVAAPPMGAPHAGTPPMAAPPLATPPTAVPSVAAPPVAPPRVVDRAFAPAPAPVEPNPFKAARPAPPAVAPPMPAAPTTSAPAVVPSMVEPARAEPAPNAVPAAIGAPPDVIPRAINSSSPPVDTVIQSEVAALPGGELSVGLMTGGRVTIHGWDQPTARLRARLTGEYWRQTKVVFGRMKSGVTLLSMAEVNGAQLIVAPSGDSGWIGGSRIRIRGQSGSQVAPVSPPVTLDNEFELWVPKSTNIRFSSAGGDVRLLEVEGTFTGTTKSGAINKKQEPVDAPVKTAPSSAPAFKQPPTIVPKKPERVRVKDRESFGEKGNIKPIPADTIIEKSMAVTSGDVLTIFADLPGNVVFHPSARSEVIVRASVPAALSATSVSLDRVKDGPRLAIAGAFARKSTTARVNYEVWMPATMQLYVECQITLHREILDTGRTERVCR